MANFKDGSRFLNSRVIVTNGIQDGDMEKREWNFRPSSPCMREMGGIRGMLAYLRSHLDPKGKSVIPLGYADPSPFECYKVSKEAEDSLVEAMRSGQYNGYAPAVGLPEARRAVAEYLSPGLPYKLGADDIYLTCGCRQAMDVTVAVLGGKDANILLPRPGYPLYEALLAYNGIEARHYNLIPERNWEIDLDHLETIADRNTVAMVLVNPNNPCGVVFSHEHLAKIIEGIRNLLNVVVDPATFAQAALPNILKKTTREFYEQALQTLCQAADICYNRAQKLDVLYCLSKPQGSMFLMIKINIPCFEDINEDVEFCGKLAKEESVIVLPGSLLGMKNWIRVSFAVSPCLLEEAWDRIESFCKRHAKNTQIIQMN